MIIITIVILFQIFVMSTSTENILDRYIVSCHSTDYVCFKRQYSLLRDKILLGYEPLGIPEYQPYLFQYGDTSTCVKVTGMEESLLAGIKFDGVQKKFSMTLAMPIRLRQVYWNNGTMTCNLPDRDFENKGRHTGPLKKFAGNATAELTYPFRIELKGDEMYLVLEEENLDVILDIPDLSQYDQDSELERKWFEWSEWAYDVVQHVDVPEHFMVPYINQVKKIYTTLPLKSASLTETAHHTMPVTTAVNARGAGGACLNLLPISRRLRQYAAISI